MNAVYKFAILAITLVVIVSSIELTPRKASSMLNELYLSNIYILMLFFFSPSKDCAYLINRIYCYGGYINGYSGNDILSALDINKNNGQPYENLNSQWTTITTQPTSIHLDFRGFPQAIPLPDGKRFLFQGGYNYGKVIEDQSIVYDAETNSWGTLPNYFDASNGGNRQM